MLAYLGSVFGSSDSEKKMSDEKSSKKRGREEEAPESPSKKGKQKDVSKVTEPLHS